MSEGPEGESKFQHEGLCENCGAHAHLHPGGVGVRDSSSDVVATVFQR
jgi:hypothetical protein